MCEAGGIQLPLDSAPEKVLGGKVVSGLQLARRQTGGWQSSDRIDCDLILVSGGWSPVVNLFSHRGIKPIWNPELACFLAPACEEAILAAGSAAGIWDHEACANSGRDAATQAIQILENPSQIATVPVAGNWEGPIDPLYEVRTSGKKLKSFVDPQHDVTTDDIRLAQH